MAGLPSWARTIRFRLALTYSALVFAIAALALGCVYVALAATLDSRPLESEKFYVSDSGKVKFLDDNDSEDGEIVSAADLDLVQSAVNQRTLDTLRTYSAAGLGGLFLVSVLVGWWVSGRVLRPVGQITRTAREISASDLSRRIAATGPRDELRTLADTLDDMLARLETEFAAQRGLVDEISHELRNPVAVIQANVDAVLSDENASADDRRQAAEVVSRATAGMRRLIEDLLAVARQRSGAFAEEVVGLGSVVRNVSHEYRLLAEERGIQLDVRAPDEGPSVYADELALTRALRNLLSNALRYSPANGTLTVAVGSRRGWAWAAVRDEGPGIDAGDRHRVFDRFYSARDARNNTEATDRNGNGGHGIGLPIARQIVESLDGRLALFSELGVGSTFVIWLPDRTAEAPGDRATEIPAEDPLGR